MIAGNINVSTFWKITRYSSQEMEYSVWYPMIKMFEYVSTVFPLSNEKVNFNSIKVKHNKLTNEKYWSLNKKIYQ